MTFKKSSYVLALPLSIVEQGLPFVLKAEAAGFIARNAFSTKDMAQRDTTGVSSINNPKNSQGLLTQQGASSTSTHEQGMGAGTPLCCPRCLKAHLIRKAKELGMDVKNVKPFLASLGEEVGHNGYYMDGEGVHEI